MPEDRMKNELCGSRAQAVGDIFTLQQSLLLDRIATLEAELIEVLQDRDKISTALEFVLDGIAKGHTLTFHNGRVESSLAGNKRSMEI